MKKLYNWTYSGTGSFQKHGFWIHDIRESSESVSGYYILPACTCSVCGTKYGHRTNTCPNCGCIMDQPPQTKMAKLSV